MTQEEGYQHFQRLVPVIESWYSAHAQDEFAHYIWKSYNTLQSQGTDLEAARFFTLLVEIDWFAPEIRAQYPGLPDSDVKYLYWSDNVGNA